MDNKQGFINGIALRSAVNSATQTRSTKHPVYSLLVRSIQSDSNNNKKLKAERKKVVIDFWKNKLKEHAIQYMAEKRDAAFFIADVLLLQDEINSDANHKSCFEGAGIRVAQCQKSLSVYLKWLWCANIMKEEPPLCPIDRNVLDQCLKELDKKEDTEYITTIKNVQKSGGWGQLKDISEYKKLVEIIQKLSERKGMTPAVWELAFFNGVIDAEEDLEG